MTIIVGKHTWGNTERLGHNKKPSNVRKNSVSKICEWGILRKRQH